MSAECQKHQIMKALQLLFTASILLQLAVPAQGEVSPLVINPRVFGLSPTDFATTLAISGNTIAAHQHLGSGSINIFSITASNTIIKGATINGRCKMLSVICLSSLRPYPSGVRRSEGERSEPSAAEPRRGKDAPRAKNWSRAGHRGFMLGCHETQPTQNPNDPPNQS